MSAVKLDPTTVLRQRQALPLDAKIAMSKKRIREWAEAWDDMVYVAFSGGKDSQVLLHLVRATLGPDVPAVFYDTGLEYPEVKDVVRATENVVWVRPTMSYREVVEKYGYPVVSKQASHILRMLNNPNKKNAASRKFYLTGVKRDGSHSRHFLLAKKWRHLIGAPFKIHNACCDVFKKQPAYRYEKASGRKPFIGTLADESRLRLWKYVQHGCNAFDKKHPTSTPLSFWTNSDVLAYHRRHELPLAAVYGDIVQLADGTLATTGEQRTGCVWCMFGAENTGPDGLNRFQRLFFTHPKIWRYCTEDMGLRKVLDFVGVDVDPPWDAQPLVKLGGRK